MKRLSIVFFTGLLLASLLAGCAVFRTDVEPPIVTLADLGVREMGLFEQRYRLRLRIQNPNDFALHIRGLSYDLDLNGREFARGVSAQDVTVPGFGEALIEVDAVSNLARVVDQVLDFGKQGALSYRLAGQLRLGHAVSRVPFEYRGEISLTPGGDRGG